MHDRLGWACWALAASLAACGDASESSDTASPTGGSGSTGAEPPRSDVTLVINELACDGAEFVEIVNVGTASVELAEVFVTDDQGGPHRATFDVTSVTPGGFAVAMLTDFGVRCGEEPAQLWAADGLIDEVIAPAGAGTSWGRLPDGTGEWTTTSLTPGAPNQPAVALPDLFDPLLIHEIEVELSDASFAAIEAEAVTPSICVPHDRDYFAGTVTIDGERFEGVGVRARGNGTADSL